MVLQGRFFPLADLESGVWVLVGLKILFFLEMQLRGLVPEGILIVIPEYADEDVILLVPLQELEVLVLDLPKLSPLLIIVPLQVPL